MPDEPVRLPGSDERPLQIQTFLIGLDKSVKFKKFKVKENKVKIHKDYEVTFDPESIFLFKRFFRQAPCLIVVEGKAHAEKLKNPIPLEDGFPPMTCSEISELIKKEVAKARMRVKPISLNQFIVLILLNIVTIILVLAVLNGVKI